MYNTLLYKLHFRAQIPKYTYLCFIRPVWLHGSAIVYKLSGCGFESRRIHLNILINVIYIFLPIYPKGLKILDPCHMSFFSGGFMK